MEEIIFDLEVYKKFVSKLWRHRFTKDDHPFFHNHIIDGVGSKMSIFEDTEQYATARSNFARDFVNKYRKHIIICNSVGMDKEKVTLDHVNKAYFIDGLSPLSVGREYEWIMASNKFITDGNDWIYESKIVDYRVDEDSHKSPDFILKHPTRGKVGIEVTRTMHNIIMNDGKKIRDNDKWMKELIKRAQINGKSKVEDKVFARVNNKIKRTSKYEQCDENYLIVMCGDGVKDVILLALNRYVNYEYSKLPGTKYFNKIIVM